MYKLIYISYSTRTIFTFVTKLHTCIYYLYYLCTYLSTSYSYLCTGSSILVWDPFDVRQPQQQQQECALVREGGIIVVALLSRKRSNMYYVNVPHTHPSSCCTPIYQNSLMLNHKYSLHAAGLQSAFVPAVTVPSSHATYMFSFDGS